MSLRLYLRMLAAFSLIALLGLGTTYPARSLTAQTLSTGSFPSLQRAAFAGTHVVHQWNMVEESSYIVAPSNLLSSTPLSGGTSLNLLGILQGQGRVERFVISPNQQHVVFSFRRHESKIELYSIPVSGGSATLLGPNYPGNYKGGQLVFAISNNSSQVIFLSDSERFNAYALFSVPIEGGPITTLSVPLPGISDIPGQVTGFSFMPNDTHLSPLSGGSARTLTTENAWLGGISFSADGQYLFTSLGRNPNRGLYRITIADSTSLRLDDPATSAGSLWDILFTPSGQYFVYSAQSTADAPIRIFSVAPTGGTVRPLSNNLSAEESNLWAMAVGPADTVLFATGINNSIPAQRWRKLYVVPADGSQAPRLISPPMPNSTVFLPLVQH
ncbi:MAG: hypothetical protein AB4911_04080 [Oscillochloridaceae bacterium umkhey_bin13]